VNKPDHLTFMLAPNPPFNVLILYDTAHSGACAATVYERLLQNLEPDYQFQMQSWRFSMLSLPSVALWAKRDAAAADMVIVAWGGDPAELAGVRSWFEDWPCASPDSRRALVSLCTGPEPAPGDPLHIEVNAMLQSLADRAGMDLISSLSPPSGSLASPTMDEVYGLPTLLAERLPYTAIPTIAEAPVLQTAFRHGGINE
jgi:hypothetical protein